MSAFAVRSLILAGVLALFCVASAFVGTPPPVEQPRWPAQVDLYTVDGWLIGPAAVDRQHGVVYVTRTYRHASGRIAQLALATSREAKRIYRAGADVPFRGNGYMVRTLSSDVLGSSALDGAYEVRRGREHAVLVYAYGERRGGFGNGPVAWGWAAYDGLARRPNDYYLLSILVPTADDDPQAIQAASELADALIPRLSTWYAVHGDEDVAGPGRA